MNLLPLWIYCGIVVAMVGGGLVWAWWAERQPPPSVKAELEDLVKRYADPDLRWPKPRERRRVPWRPR